MKLKALLSALLIVVLLSPAALTEEALSEPMPVLEEVAVTDSSEEVAEPDGETVSSDSIDAVAQDAAPDVEDEGESEQPEQPQDSVPADSEEEMLVVETVDEVVEEADFEEDYVCFEAEVADDVDFVSDEAADGVAAGGDIVIDSTNFPDDNFRAYIAGWFNKNEGDSLSEAERAEVRGISINGADNGEIKNLTGIKLFPNLERLTAVMGSITTIDVSGCSNLKEINCYENQLISLNVSSCTNLVFLHCAWNKLTSLNVENCSKLETLRCDDNQLTKLDVSDYTKLRRLNCRKNQLTVLNVSGCTALEELKCDSNRLTTLDISTLTKIVPYVTDQYKRTEYKSGLCFSEDYDTWEENGEVYGYPAGCYLICDNGVNLITEAAPVPAPASAPVPAPAPAPAPATPTIPAVKKAGKTTVSAAPGSVYQLDLGGAGGKAFKSSKKKVAVVNGAGQVTIRGAGKTKITFKVGKKKRTVTLTVKDPTIPTSVSLNPVNTAAKVGDAVTLTPVISPETNSTFKWKSSNKKVASVSNGVVTFKKAGKVTITCTAVRGKKKAKVTFRVSK